MKNPTHLLSVVAALAASAASALAQGPLSPPPGPPAPSMKSLDQIEPRTPIAALPFAITAPGSYYVTGNLSVPDNYQGDGITVQTDNVIIDLGGFTIDGRSTARHGITTDDIRHSVQVKNGNVQNWQQRGVNLQFCSSSILEGVQARNNRIGIFAAYGTVTRCKAMFNLEEGIYGNFSTIHECSAAINAIGIHVFSGSIRGSRVSENTNSGILASRTLVESCQVEQNRWGIADEGGSNIQSNTVLFSSSDGIRMVASGGSRVAENNISGSGVTVAASGIWVESSGNRIAGNNVVGTNGAGIGVGGSFNTIDNNSVLQNGGIGLQVAGGKNTVVRNSSLGNSANGVVNNYSIDPGNNPGPVNAANASNNPWSNTQ
jgi:parallel beta-helix repeat protein